MDKKDKKEKIEKRLFEITVKAVVINDKNEVLLLKRSKKDNRYPGKYDLPGGSIEAGEEIEKTLSREIEEETGLQAEIGPIIHGVDFEKEYNLEKNTEIAINGKGLRYLAFSKGGEVKLSSEHEAFEWLSFENAEKKFEGQGFEYDKREAVKKAKEYLELKSARENWLKTIADFENYKKRQAESAKDMIAYSNANLISEILPVLDNFHASTDHIPVSQKKSPWVTGIMHIQKQLEKVLEDNGVLEIRVNEGDEFDPGVMEAMSDTNDTNPHSNDTNKNRVKKILVRGYKMGERVVRAARVTVE